MFPFLIVNVDDPGCCKKHSIAAVAGWKHAIKHVNPQADTLQQVPGCSHSHQVPWFFRRQVFATQSTEFIQEMFRFTYAQSSNRISRSIFVADEIARSFS